MESIIKSIKGGASDEVYHLLKFKFQKSTSNPERYSKLAKHWQWLYNMLNLTSRSFAFVINELPDETRDAVALFYVVLRALDSVEDDTAVPEQLRKQHLNEFYTYLSLKGKKIMKIGENDNEKHLLENFDLVVQCFLDTDPKYQSVIRQITKDMGHGMAEFLHKGSVDSLEEWDLYCHYVAGLVGYGLSSIFQHCGLENPQYFKLENCSRQANSMGLFLQKTNIIRDYHEDIVSSRIFWPGAVWKKYAVEIKEFLLPEKINKAVECLNELVTNALEHIPDCLEYMSQLKNPNNFNFCAIPQVMAIATLAECYNNPKVFSQVVKIRRGTSAKILYSATNIQSVYRWFYDKLLDIYEKIPKDDPNRAQTLAIIHKIMKIIAPEISSIPSFTFSDGFAIAGLALSAGYLISRYIPTGRTYPKL